MVEEKWKVIPQYEKYEVSNLGNVRDVGSKELCNQWEQNGYKMVYLKCGYKKKASDKRVHRLVALAFVDGHFKNAIIDHINDNKTDNRAENLQWITPSLNTKKHHFNKRNEEAKGCRVSCYHCGKVFSETKIVFKKQVSFCSHKCAQKATESDYEVRCCKVCNREITLRPRQSRHSYKKVNTCSKACQNVFQSTDNENYRKECIWCHKEFKKPKNITIRRFGKRLYCSNKCSASAKGSEKTENWDTTDISECVNCSKEYKRKKGEKKKTFFKRQYCGLPCKYEAQIKHTKI